MITEATIHRTGLAQLAADLFLNRHVRLDPIPVCTPAHVIAAYRALGLIDQPWPSKYDANRQVLRVQAQLDRDIL